MRQDVLQDVRQDVWQDVCVETWRMDNANAARNGVDEARGAMIRPPRPRTPTPTTHAHSTRTPIHPPCGTIKVAYRRKS